MENPRRHRRGKQGFWIRICTGTDPNDVDDGIGGTDLAGKLNLKKREVTASLFRMAMRWAQLTGKALVRSGMDLCISHPVYIADMMQLVPICAFCEIIRELLMSRSISPVSGKRHPVLLYAYATSKKAQVFA